MDNFTPLRNGLVDHIQQGKLCPFDLGIYAFLHLHADWATGIYQGCALGIAHGFNEPSLKHHINKSLIRLRDRQYINYPRGCGRRGGYPILINKYQPRVGELCGTRLNAWKHGELCKPEYEPWNSRGTVEEQSGNSRGRVEEPYQEVKKLQEVKEESDGAKAPSRHRARSKKAEVEMPEDFRPKESHRVLAAKLGVDMERTFKKFRDDRISKGCKYVDWDRAFNTWLRNEADFRRGKTFPANRGNGALPADYTPESEKLRLKLQEVGQ